MAAWLKIVEPPWVPLFTYYVGQTILESGHTQIVTTAGTSGSSAPAWNHAGGTTADGSAVWTDLGTGGIAGSGLTDRTNYLSMSESAEHNFSLQMRQRGQASIDLYVTDTYSPTIGTQIYLYDVTSTGSTLVFAGTIDELETRWLDRTTKRVITVRCVTFEQLFDTILVPTRLYENKTAGYIFNDLLSLVSGSPISAGTISTGTLIVSFQCDGRTTIADVYGQLAQVSGYIWGVEVSTLTAYFQAPSTTPAPFALTYASVLQGSLTLKTSRQEFRDWQGITLGPEAFAHSAEFFTGAGQKTFTLMRPVKEVTNVWVVYPPGSQNYANGSLSGQPSNGDTVTFTFPTSGSIYNWAAAAPYSVDQIVIDDAGHIQRCTFAGTSGGSTPSWNDSGGVTIDNTVIWQDDGPAGFGSDQLAVYTFVTVLDNTQWGQVLIGADVNYTMFNLMSAINADVLYRGVNYSLPTWENPLVNAENTYPSAAIVVRNKSAGQGYITALGKSCANWAWDASQTYGGGTGHTLTIPISVNGTSTQGFVYTPGSADCALATPLNVGSSLQIEYTRADVGLIAVQDDELIAQRALIEDSTGLYQQITDGTNSLAQTSNATGLQFAQEALSAFSDYPQTMQFDTYVPGLAPGQYINVTMDYPLGSNVLLNANWIVQEVSAELLQATPYMAGFGHYKYTIYLISVAQTSSYLDFWQGLGGGSGGSGGSSLATLGGGSQKNGLQAPALIKGATILPTLTLEQDTPSTGWVALTAYNVNDTILDFNSHIQLCTIGGTSGAAQPTWNTAGGTTADGTVTWSDQGANGGLSLLAGNIRALYNVIMAAAAFTDNTGSGVVGHFGIDAQVAAVQKFLFIRNTVGAPMMTFDAALSSITANMSFGVGTGGFPKTFSVNGTSAFIDSSGASCIVVTKSGAAKAIDVAYTGTANAVAMTSNYALLATLAVTNTAAGTGITATCSAGVAIEGISTSSIGISAFSSSYEALRAISTTGKAIYASGLLDFQNGHLTMGGFGSTPSVSPAGQIRMYVDGSGILQLSQNGGAYAAISTGAAVAGSTTQVQYNNAGAFGASADFTWNNATKILTVAGSITEDLDNSALSVDAGGLRRLGFTKKSGAIPRLTYGSGINFEIAESSATTIDAANTFTTRLTISTAGAVQIPGALDVTGALTVTGSKPAAGSNQQVMFNAVGLLAGDAGLTFASGIGILSATFVTTTGLTVTTSGIGVTAGGITVTAGGITVTAGSVTLSAGSLSASGNLLLGGSTRLFSTGAASLTAMTMNGNAGFTGTLAAAISAGKNVDNGIIY
jgi:hypothetical protein